MAVLRNDAVNADASVGDSERTAIVGSPLLSIPVAYPVTVSTEGRAGDSWRSCGLH